MTVVGAGLVVVLFILMVERAGLPAMAGEAWERSRASLDVVRNEGLSDDEKERALREATPALMRLVVRVLAGSAASLAVPLAALWLLDRAGWASLPEVLTFLARLDVLAGLTLVGVGVAIWSARRGKGSSSID